tara:strand:- start:157 stop:816 length:660 start_codon:yes stop_codon:yes gene_type:complete
MQNQVVADVAIVLVGGPSSRMGESKALFEIDGKPMLIHVIESLYDSGISKAILSFKNQKQSSEIVDKLNLKRSGNKYFFPSIPIPFYLIFDKENNQLKNSAITGLIEPINFAMKNGWGTVQITPCDVPYISPNLPKLLFSKLSLEIDCVVPKTSKGLEPLLICAKTTPLLTSLQKGREAAHQVISEMKNLELTSKDWINVGISESSFTNINSKAELIKK